MDEPCSLWTASLANVVSPFEDIDLEDLEAMLADYVDKPPTTGAGSFETPVTWETLMAWSD